MKSPLVTLFGLFAISMSVSAEQAAPQSLEGLLQQVKAFKAEEQGVSRAKETEFLNAQKEQKRLLAEAKQALKNEQRRADRLKEQFDVNEKKLSEKETELNENVGNLGELFGVVRQVSEELQTELTTSLTQIDKAPAAVDLESLAASKQLPQIEELKGLWLALQQQMTLSGQVKEVQATVVGLDGVETEQKVVRVGVFNALQAEGNEGYLRFDVETGRLLEMSRQPAEASYVSDFLSSAEQNEFAPIGVDPTRGALLDLVISNPDILGRVQQGSYVGYAIILIGILGVLLSLWRLQVLTATASKMKKQKENPAQADETNPLGRVLSAYHNTDKSKIDLETLELKMDEAILREVPDLEKGNSLIKLFAGVAPLLGLLGTVVGMIATFQAITNFGTGDPKLMAGGISQALITTVLGLLAAIPLLLLHNVVNTRSKSLIHTLDEESAGLIASAMESNKAGKE